jgi:hypothetical protein
MRRLFLTAALSVSLAFAAHAFAQSEDGIDVPSGMEVVKVGGTNVLVPKGTRVTRKDAALILEPLDEYASRLLLMLEQEITALKTQIVGLQEQTAQLRSRLAILEGKSQQ